MVLDPARPKRLLTVGGDALVFVEVDGKQVARGVGFSREVHTFLLHDDDTAHQAELEVLGIVGVKTLKLTVAGQELLTAAPPAEE